MAYTDCLYSINIHRQLPNMILTLLKGGVKELWQASLMKRFANA